ncbi:MAG: TIGR03936 family radical SAM-associated protein, partial [Candidatus Omnitrophota bacterium]
MRQSSFVIDIEFSKQKELIYISHLDVVRLFMRTFRRADLPLVYTQGYNPHPKISFKRAL